MRWQEIIAETVPDVSVEKYWLNPTTGEQIEVTGSDYHYDLVMWAPERFRVSKAEVTRIARYSENDSEDLLNLAINAGWVRVGIIDHREAYVHCRDHATARPVVEMLLRRRLRKIEVETTEDGGLQTLRGAEAMSDYIRAELTEEFVSAFRGIKGQTCEIFRNPSRADLNKMARYGEARAFLIGDDILAWNTFAALHQMVKDELKLPDTAIPVTLSPFRTECYVMVTDTSERTQWWHNPDVVAAIEANGYLRRQFKTLDIDFYDSAIVGDWRTLNEDGRVVKGVNTTCDVGEDEIIRQAAKFGNRVDRNGVPANKLFEGAHLNRIIEIAKKYPDVERFIRATDGEDVLYRGHSGGETSNHSFMTDYVGHAANYGDTIDAFAYTQNDVHFYDDERFNEMRRYYRRLDDGELAQLYREALAGNRHAGEFERALGIVKLILNSDIPYSRISPDFRKNDRMIPLMQKFAHDQHGKNIIAFVGNDYADYGGQNEFVVGDVSKLVDLRKLHASVQAGQPLSESTLTLNAVNQFGHRDTIRCFINPRPEQLLAFGTRMRGIIYDWQIIWWQAKDAIHITVANDLGIPGGSSSDEDRRLKLFGNKRSPDDGVNDTGEFYIACHESQIEHEQIKRYIAAGIPVETFSR